MDIERIAKYVEMVGRCRLKTCQLQDHLGNNIAAIEIADDLLQALDLLRKDLINEMTIQAKFAQMDSDIGRVLAIEKLNKLLVEIRREREERKWLENGWG